MAILQICDCGGHIFVVLSGSWEPFGISNLRSPVTMWCVACGKELLTASWGLDEPDHEPDFKDGETTEGG